MGGGPTAQHPQGTTILVLGIVGLALTFICGFGALLGPFAWAMGTKALREIDSNPSVTYTNRGNVSAGRILGIITTALLAIGVLLLVIIVIATAASSN